MASSKGSTTTAAGHATPVTATKAPTPSTTVPLLAAGQQGTAAQVPWGQVGPGWLLAEWSPNTPSQYAGPAPGTTLPFTSDRLYLIDPVGGRYQLDFPSPSTQWALVGWSGDGKRALLREGSSGVTVVDLPTGTSSSSTVSGSVQFTEPQGTALISGQNAPGTTVGHNSPTVDRYSLSGALQYAYPTTYPGAGSITGFALETPDGTQVLLATTAGFELVGNDGTPVRILPVPSSVSDCNPVRWYSPGVALIACQSHVSVLWLLPIDGSAPTALTTPSPPSSGDFGDTNAWSTPSGTYVQALGACGFRYVAKLPAGSTNPVKVDVPGLLSGKSQFILGTYQGKLAITGSYPCAGGQALVWFDPATDSVVPVLGGPVNGGSVVAALLYGEPSSV